MNVLQLTPELNAGGVERTTIEMAEALITAGHSSHVVSAGGRMEDELIKKGAHLHRFDIGSKNILTYPSRVRLLKKIIQEHKIDIVHARSRAPAWIGHQAAKDMNTAFMSTYHGIYNANSSIKRRYNAIMTKGALTIANSNMTKDHIIKEHGLEESRIIVIPRGVDLDMFDPAKINAADIKTVRQSWGAAPSDHVLLLPGRLTEWKGQRVAILAMLEADSNIRLVIMGDAQGRTAYAQQLNKLIKDYNLSGSIHMADHNKNMPLMIAASDLVLSTSIEPEAFGRVAIEAQAMGKPVIATANGGTLETVLDKQTGLWVEPNDQSALGRAIGSIFRKTPHSWLHDYNPAFARDHIVRNFSKRALQSKTLDVYNRLLTRSSV